MRVSITIFITIIAVLTGPLCWPDENSNWNFISNELTKLNQSNPAKDKAQNQKEKIKQFEKLKRSKDFPFLIAIFQYSLWQLGYYGIPAITGKVDEETKKALYAYQRRMGLKTTRDLDIETFEKIEKDSSLLETDPASLPGYYFSDYLWDSFFSGKGTWIFENEKEDMAFPLQTTRIECYRNQGICFEATASLFNNFLSVDLEEYEIERWDNFEIVTGPYDYQCTRYVLRINRQLKSVKKIRTTLRTKKACKGVDAQDKYITLVDGFKVGNKVREDRNKAIRDAQSQYFKEAFEKFLK